MLNIEKIISSEKTIFSIEDLQIILGTSNKYSIRNYLSKSSKKGIIQNLYYGIWGLANYDINELAAKIKKDSYISLETVLQREAIIFQDYSSCIFLISDKTLEKNTEKKIFLIKKIKKSIRINPIGLINKGNYAIASVERAICDRLYLSGEYYFDNLDNVNLEKLEEISKIYDKNTILLVSNLIKDVKSK